MAGKKTKPFGWFAHGPLGPWGRWLGFRWVFPIGTMPVPYHPLVFPLALTGTIVWAIHSALAPVARGIGPGWPAMLFAAALLGGLMSIPILAWAVMALGGRIIQTVLILCAMVVIAAQGAAGKISPWLAGVPLVFFAVWLVQFVLGRITRRRVMQAWSGHVPPELRDRPLALSHDFTWGTAVDLFNRHTCNELWLIGRDDSGTARGHFRLDPDTLAKVRSIAGETMPEGWKLTHLDAFWMLERAGPVPADAVRLTSEEWHAPLRCLAPGLRKVTVDDGHVRSLIWGQIYAIAPIPLFEAFHWTAIFGGQSQWRVGFVHGRVTRIGKLDDRLGGIVTFPDEPLPLPPDRLDPLLDDLTAAVASRRNLMASFRAAITADPAGYSSDSRALNLLQSAGPDSLGPDAGPFLLDWLHRARDARKREAVYVAAGLIAKLSEAAFAALAPELAATLNSRKLALEWKLVPGFDPAPLPKQTPRFGDRGGFGLILRHPALYVRLGETHPVARDLIVEIAKEMDLPKPAMKAIERWKAEADPSPPPPTATG